MSLSGAGMLIKGPAMRTHYIVGPEIDSYGADMAGWGFPAGPQNFSPRPRLFMLGAAALVFFGALAFGLRISLFDFF